MKAVTKSTNSSYGRNEKIWENPGTKLTRSQSLLDHEMTEMSPFEKISYLQSKMLFDRVFLESNVDSNLDDGELQKLLTFTTMCPKSFLETRWAALFSPKRNEQRSQTRSSVLGNVNLSNLNGTLLEGNADHLLNETRSEQVRTEIHVESFKKCIDDSQKRT